MSTEQGSYRRFTERALSIGVIVVALSCPALGSEWTRPVPKASCGPHDRPESVQGQTTVAERFAPGPTKAYTCNLELVGQFEGEGADAGVAVFEDCAYYSTAPNPKMKKPGVVVLDVSDSRHPKATAYLASPAMLHAHKSLEVSPVRKLLLAAEEQGPNLDTYDISNCRHPVLKSSAKLPGGIFSHAGQLSADGLTFFGAQFGSRNPLVFAIDTSDPANPRTIATWVPPNDKEGWIPHGAVINKDATRAYVSMKRMTDDGEKSISPNGLTIFDISDVHTRRAGAQFRLISTLFWDDTHGSSGMMTVKIKGRPYLIFSDSLGTIGYRKPVRPDACGSEKPGHGFVRIIDISNEEHPKVVSKLMPEVSDPTNCSRSVNDPTLFGSYGSFACSVDNVEEGKLLACGNFEGGLRVFDIRDPARPREVAYYKPPARRTQERPGSLFRPQTDPARDNTADSVIVAPKFRRSGQEIWFTSVDNGFQVVRFSDRFLASHSDLF